MLLIFLRQDYIFELKWKFFYRVCGFQQDLQVTIYRCRLCQIKLIEVIHVSISATDNFIIAIEYGKSMENIVQILIQLKRQCGRYRVITNESYNIS